MNKLFHKLTFYFSLALFNLLKAVKIKLLKIIGALFQEKKSQQNVPNDNRY